MRPQLIVSCGSYYIWPKANKHRIILVPHLLPCIGEKAVIEGFGLCFRKKLSLSLWLWKPSLVCTCFSSFSQMSRFFTSFFWNTTAKWSVCFGVFFGWMYKHSSTALMYAYLKHRTFPLDCKCASQTWALYWRHWVYSTIVTKLSLVSSVQKKNRNQNWVPFRSARNSQCVWSISADKVMVAILVARNVSNEVLRAAWSIERKTVLITFLLGAFFG